MDEGECFRQQSALPGNYTSGHRGMLTWRDVFLMGLTAAEANLVLLPFDLQGEKNIKMKASLILAKTHFLFQVPRVCAAVFCQLFFCRPVI